MFPCVPTIWPACIRVFGTRLVFLVCAVLLFSSQSVHPNCSLMHFERVFSYVFLFYFQVCSRLGQCLLGTWVPPRLELPDDLPAHFVPFLWVCPRLGLCPLGTQVAFRIKHLVAQEHAFRCMFHPLFEYNPRLGICSQGTQVSPRLEHLMTHRCVSQFLRACSRLGQYSLGTQDAPCLKHLVSQNTSFGCVWNHVWQPHCKAALPLAGLWSGGEAHLEPIQPIDALANASTSGHNPWFPLQSCCGCGAAVGCAETTILA
jgi:hypothetical protein